MKKHTIAILGTGGKTGKYLLDQLTQQGFALKLLIRNPALFEYKHPDIEIVRGDALDAEAIDAVTEGCEAVISLIGQRKGEPLVAAASTRLLIASLQKHNIVRYVAVAGLTVSAPGDGKSIGTKIAALIMKAFFGSAVADKQAAYDALSQSNLQWTLVRVPYIVFTNVRSRIEVSLTDCPGGKVNSANLAAFIIAQLSDTSYYRKAPFIANA